MDARKKFRDHFAAKLEEFFDVLSSQFGDVEQFTLAKTLIRPACLVDGDALLPIMREVFRVKTLIFERREDFFLDENNDIFAAAAAADPQASDHTNALRDLWLSGRMTVETKSTIWEWLGVLAKYCQRYGECAGWN